MVTSWHFESTEPIRKCGGFIRLRIEVSALSIAQKSYLCPSLKQKMAAGISIKNKRAGFEYFLSEEFTAGIVLTGTEIKSVREGKANLTDAFCVFIGTELYVRNMHISEYKFGTYANHEPKRDRKLLLNRRELRKILTKTREKGLTIVPTLMFINEKGLAKINIAIAKGKKLYDKRETLKTKDTNREIDRHKEG
jgi:SsrA-binding protein